MIRRALRRLRRVDDAAVAAWRRVRGAETTWHGIADLVTAHPWPALLVSLLLLLPPLAAIPSLKLSHDELAQLPASSESVRGFEAIADHIPEGELSPIVLVIEDEDTQVWEPEAMLALEMLSRNLKNLDRVATVRSVAMPTNGDPPEETAPREQIAGFSARLDEAANGAQRVRDGVERLREGLQEIDERLPELASGLDRAVDGTGRLGDGAAEAIAGVERLRDGTGQLTEGLNELRTGLVRARDGARTLQTDVAEPAEDNVRNGYDALAEMTTGRTDPMYERARREVGEAYARITGEYPPGHPRAGQQVREDYEGLPEALGELASGLDDAIDGVDRLRDGISRLDGGLAELGDGLRELRDGISRLEDGLVRADDGVARLRDGIDEMLTGVRERLLPGVERLADGLTQAAQNVQQEDLQALLPTSGPGPFVVTPEVLALQPQVKEELDFFVADDGTRTRLFIGMKQAPYTRSTIESIDRVEEIAQLSLTGSPLEDAQVLPTGTSAFFSDMDDIASRDFRLIMVAVILGVYLVLALLLRSLVAPLYMVGSVLLSFGVALGITTFVFQGVLGRPGIAWYIPPMLFVLLVALGVDYNIFLMSRVREEAAERPTAEAVASGLRLTGGVITSAGLILAGTFAALMFAPLDSLAQIGFAVTVGILLDTFVVRSFVVPSTAVLLGRHNWWPSSRAAREPSPG